MINIKRLNPKYILPNGRYWDYDKGEMYLLYDDEILALREYYHNPNIAINRNIKKYKEPIVSNGFISRSKEVAILLSKKSRVVSSTTGRRFKIVKKQKYNSGKYKMGTSNAGIKFIDIVVDDIIVFYVKESFKYVNDKKKVGNPNAKNVDKDIVRKFINKYAKVFHLNEDVAYNKLSEITEEFTSTDFTINMTCKELTCKGNQVYADTFVELFIYYLRVLKQTPEKYDLNYEDLVSNTDYQTNEDSYGKVIGEYSQILRENPCIVYALIEAETNWQSKDFLEYHNPARLMSSVGLCRFDTFEEGLVETIIQIKSYRLKGANTIDEIVSMHSIVDDYYDNVDALIDNVKKIYDEVFNKQKELLGKEYILDDKGGN